jgi:hypothetical protein
MASHVFWYSEVRGESLVRKTAYQTGKIISDQQGRTAASSTTEHNVSDTTTSAAAAIDGG